MVTRPVRVAIVWSAIIAGATALAVGTGWLAADTAVGLGSVAIAVALAGGLLASAADTDGIVPSTSGRPADGLAFEEAAPRAATPGQSPPDLLLAERLVVLAGATAADVHFRLRPALRDIAVEVLASGPLIDLDGDPRAPALLGDELWDLVRPDRPAPDVRQAPGLDPVVLEQLIARLEALA